MRWELLAAEGGGSKGPPLHQCRGGCGTPRDHPTPPTLFCLDLHGHHSQFGGGEGGGEMGVWRRDVPGVGTLMGGSTEATLGLTGTSTDPRGVFGSLEPPTLSLGWGRGGGGHPPSASLCPGWHKCSACPAQPPARRRGVVSFALPAPRPFALLPPAPRGKGWAPAFAGVCWGGPGGGHPRILLVPSPPPLPCPASPFWVSQSDPAHHSMGGSGGNWDETGDAWRGPRTEGGVREEERGGGLRPAAHPGPG